MLSIEGRLASWAAEECHLLREFKGFAQQGIEGLAIAVDMRSCNGNDEGGHQEHSFHLVVTNRCLKKNAAIRETRSNNGMMKVALTWSRRYEYSMYSHSRWMKLRGSLNMTGTDILVRS